MNPSPTVIVTGASSGIGRAIAYAWAERGATVVVSARDRAELAELARDIEVAGGKAIVQAGDVTREEERVALIDAARTKTGRLDVLVNNAGRGFYGSVARIGAEEIESLFALNVIAPLRLAELSIDPLTRTGGCIVMMSSLAGLVSPPGMGAYSASKFALEALSMSLRAELGGTGIRVVVIRPGPVETAFRAHSITTDGRPRKKPFGAQVQTAEDVAEQVLRAVARGRAVVETTPFVRLGATAARVTPGVMRWVYSFMASRSD